MNRAVMQRPDTGIALLALVMLQAPPLAAQPKRPAFVPVTDSMLADPDPADWLTWRRTLDGWGHSPLDQINRGNVERLRLAWSRDVESGASQEGTPLVYDGVLYFPGPLDVIQAFDAGTGKMIWEYRRPLPEDVGSFIPFPSTNRNLAIYDNLIIDNGSDDYVYALDAGTGELAWETRIFDYRVNPAKQGSGPIVADGKLISGRNCMPRGGPETCVITAHDAKSGEELWRTRTIPKPGEPGGDTWGDVAYPNRWHVGSWLVPSYDPQIKLVYVGTSVTSPAPKFMLAGNDEQYLYHNSTLALDVDTGEIVWHYQHAVDHWDLDHAFERLLIDTAVAPDAGEVPWINPQLIPGERRKVVTGIPGKTGLIYTLDRETGEFLWARPTVMQNVVSHIDGATGEVTINPRILFTGANQQVTVCPNTNGGKNWPAGAYDPQAGVMYFPMQNTCMTSRSTAAAPSLDSVYAISNSSDMAPGTSALGTVQAFSAVTGKLAWRYDQPAGVTALVSTAGRLLFLGDVSGRFRALDAQTGEVLWETDLGSSVTGHPVTFAVDDRQYVAVSVGSSNLTSALARMTPELRPAGDANKLFVFTLPD